MGNHNSLDHTIVDLYCKLYQDIADSCCVAIVESRRDIEEIQNRVASEGLSFLTKVMPRLGKCFDKALLQGHISEIPNFQKKSGSILPSFLGGIFLRVFKEDGVLLCPPDVVAVKAIRQLAYYVYKLEMAYTESDTSRVIEDFLKTEDDLGELSIPTDSVFATAQSLVGTVFSRFDVQDIIPAHGPGNVATGEEAWRKPYFSRIYKEIEKVYPFTEYFQYSLMHVCDEREAMESLDLLGSGTAKVVLVPKDSRGPRLISCEPLEYQWIQQGLSRKVVDRIESHSYTKGHVNFTSQMVNRHLALVGSVSGEWVTLDMKEASDRVHLDLVKGLFAHNPEVLNALLATRSTSTRLPDGRVIELKKFAPMGSALCFPVEALIFWSLSVAAIVDTYRIPQARARDMVYVYGDDLIIRSEVYAAVLEHLPRFGLLFNTAKCCTTGSFRESCGLDAYKGVDVTPLKLRRVWPHRRSADSRVYTSYVSHYKEAYRRGYYRLAETIKLMVEAHLGTLPITNSDIGVLSWVHPGEAAPHHQPPNVKIRVNRALFILEVFGWQPYSKQKIVSSDDWCTVLSRINSGPEACPAGVYTIPHRSYLKRGWSPFGV